MPLGRVLRGRNAEAQASRGSAHAANARAGTRGPGALPPWKAGAAGSMPPGPEAFNDALLGAMSTGYLQGLERATEMARSSWGHLPLTQQ